MTNFAERFGQARKRSGLTQQHLAELCGLTKGAISQYELGNNSVSGENVFPLADALSVSARWLMTGVGDGIEDGELPLPVAKTTRIAQHLAALPDERLVALSVVLGIKLEGKI